jgi:glutathione synthase/RimK-type ligase-like ATP-grasp enzyme
MILIISSARDDHAKAVMRALAKMQAVFHLLDLSEFPQHSNLAFKYNSGNHAEYTLEYSNGKRVNLSACGAIWWRRPQSFLPHPEIDAVAYQRFVMTESYEAYMGLWHSLSAFWVNRPLRDEIAHRKVYQLTVAQRLGLRIPETLITNNPDEAENFIARFGCDNTVYKAFSATEQHWRETRILKQNEMPLLDKVKYAPVIFQEYIHAFYDIRLTVIGEHLFPAAIYSQQTTYKEDMRMDLSSAKVEPVEMPEPIRQNIRALMKELDLRYGAIDLRLTPDGEYVFLEINPAGQWLFIEEKTRQPMTQTMAELLAVNDRAI